MKATESACLNTVALVYLFSSLTIIAFADVMSMRMVLITCITILTLTLTLLGIGIVCNNTRCLHVGGIVIAIWLFTFHDIFPHLRDYLNALWCGR